MSILALFLNDRNFSRTWKVSNCELLQHVYLSNVIQEFECQKSGTRVIFFSLSISILLWSLFVSLILG